MFTKAAQPEQTNGAPHGSSSNEPGLTRPRVAAVENAAPSEITLAPLKVVTAAGMVDANGVVFEGGVTTYALEFSDPGKHDTHKVVVDWGDGTEAEGFDVPAGARPDRDPAPLRR